MFTGSVGARISELKQKVIAENPRSYGLAVPRKCLHVYLVFHLSVASMVIVDLKGFLTVDLQWLYAELHNLTQLFFPLKDRIL